VTGVITRERHNVFGISGIEFLFIALLILLIFGPDKLPQFGRTIGQIMRQFNEAKDEVERVVRTEMYASEKPSSTLNSPTSPFTAPKAEAVESPASTLTAADFDEDEEDEEEE